MEYSLKKALIQKTNPFDTRYKKVIAYCEIHGPDEKYDFLLDVLEDVSKSNHSTAKEDVERINAKQLFYIARISVTTIKALHIQNL